MSVVASLIGLGLIASGPGALAATTRPATTRPATNQPVTTQAAGQVPLGNSASPFKGVVGGKALGSSGTVYDNAVKAPPVVGVDTWLLADLDSGEVIAAKNAHGKMRPASTLKTLLAVSLLPRLDRTVSYEATAEDQNIEGSKVGVEAGQSYTVDQLFYGLFLPSGNDAAHALANLNGGVPATVKLMNAEARRLGAYDTNVVNQPSGLDPDPPAKPQFSSAYDLALFAREGMKNKDFVRYATTRTFQFPGRKGKPFQIQNTNKFLWNYDGAIGIKNGFTSQARNTLVAGAERDGRRLVLITMKCDSPAWKKSAALMDWGFSVADKAKPVGVLVTPDDVARATQAKTASRSRPATQKSSPSASNSPSADPIAGASNAEPRPATSSLLDPSLLWVVGAALLFIVLASIRVAAHVRSSKKRKH